MITLQNLFLEHYIKCFETHQIPLMHALSLACALRTKPDIFISCDNKIIAAARDEKLQTVCL